MIVSKLLVSNAAEDIPQLEEIKTLIKDIFDIRTAKLRNAVDTVIGQENSAETGSNKVSFNNLTMLEIHTVRPFLPHAADLVARLERVAQAQSQNTTNMSVSDFSNSSIHTSSYT
jgi:GINS complex subunit 2